MLRNLGEAYIDATAQLRGLMQPGRFIHVYGVFYPAEPNGTAFEAKHVMLFGKAADEYRFESQDWWLRQIRKIADFYLESEFGAGRDDLRLPQLPHRPVDAGQQDAVHPAGDRHHLPPGLRAGHRLSARPASSPIWTPPRPARTT